MTIAQTAGAVAFNEWAAAHNWSARCDPTLTFESDVFRGLLTAWQEQTGSAAIPQRSQMTARVLKPYLGNVAVFERLCDGRYSVRLMGTRLTEVLGNLQGKILDDAVSPELVSRWHAVLDLVLAEARPLRFSNRHAYKGREYLQAEALDLPLSESGGPPNMVLICALFKPNVDPADVSVDPVRT